MEAMSGLYSLPDDKTVQKRLGCRADIETVSKRILKTEKLLKTSDQENKKNHELIFLFKTLYNFDY